MNYHATGFPLALRTPAIPLNGVLLRHALHLAASESVRQVRDHANGLTSKDHNYLKGFMRGQYLTGVLRFVEIGLKCDELGAATAFPEALRGFTVQHHPKAHVCVREAFHAESHANGEFDAAQLAYAADPTEVNRQWALEAGNRQLVETYRSLNALHRR